MKTRLPSLAVLAMSLTVALLPVKRISREIWTKVALMIGLCIGVVTGCGGYKSVPLASEGQKAAPSPPVTIQLKDQKTVTVPIADLTLTLPAELTERSPSIEPQKNGDVTWTNYDYVWRKNDLSFEVSVHITNWDKDFPPEAGGISPEAMLEQHYAAGEREKSRGEIEEVRYLELDGVKGVFGRVPYPGDENTFVLGWQTFRYHKGKAQSLHIMVKGVRGDLEKLMKVINSARLAQK